jgi:hypothetical protein
VVIFLRDDLCGLSCHSYPYNLAEPAGKAMRRTGRRVSEHGLRHITRKGKRSRQGRLAWNVAHSAAAACHIAPQSSALPLSACHVTPRKQPRSPRIEVPLSGEFSRPKIRTSPLCGEVFCCAANGRSCVFGPSGRA